LESQEKVDYQETFDKSEVLRAQWIIEKATRNGWNVIESLVTHMVSKSLIEELTGQTPQLVKKTKEDKTLKLREWVLAHLEQEYGTSDLGRKLGVSYDTAIKTIKENPFYFVKTRRGYYTVRDGLSEREEAKKDK